VAVLLVVLVHAGGGLLPGGFVGVDVFFVLSGFLITGLLLAEARARGSVSLLDFYVRRARRILPAAALTLMVTDVAAFFLLNFVRAREAVQDSLHAAAFAANFRFAARGVDYFAQSAPPSPLLHYWSLSVEEQFYVVWPLVLSIALFGVALLRRHRAARTLRERRLLRVVVVLAAASLGWAVHQTATLPTAAYFSPFARAWELGLGATMAVCATTLWRTPPTARLVMGWAGLLAISYAAITFSEQTSFPGLSALLPTVGTALVIVAGMGDRPPRLAVARLLALRPMCIIGDRSYGFYLWHWPVLILASAFVGHELPVSVKLSLMVGAFLLSCVSYALVENPIRRKIRGRKATAVVVAVFTAAVLGTAAVSFAAIDAKQQRFERPAITAAPLARKASTDSQTPVRGQGVPSINAQGVVLAVIAAVEAARRGAPIPTRLTPPISELGPLPRKYALPNECIGHDSSRRTGTKICRVGDPSSKKLIVLIGDSHAMMWVPAILEMAWRDHWAVVPLLRLGCTPPKWTTSYGDQACQEWHSWAIRQVRRLHPQVTLIGGNIAEQQSPLATAGIEGVVLTARALKAFGAVAIGDPEGLDRNPIDCLLSRHASMATCTTTWPPQSLVIYDEVARQMTQAGDGFLPTREFLCFERECPAVIGRTIAYFDANHISGAYAAQIAPAFRTAFLRAIPKTPR
jgi:peptidoglycan/LPS O-acetylase OafA/YrhL